MRDAQVSVKAVVWLFVSILCFSCMEFYVAKIWSADQPPGFSDLFAPWWGAHELFLHGRNPYTPAVAREIQTEIYGSPASATYHGDPSELAGGFAYPLHAALLLWPTIFLPFPTVQTIFLLVSILVTLASLWLWLRGFHFNLPWVQLFTLAFFTLGSFPAAQAIRLQNLSLIAAALLATAICLLASKHLSLAGIVLALSTFKPQFCFLLIFWIALWTLSDWRRRQPLAWSFVASMLLLLGASEWLLPGWLGYFLRTAEAYTHYTPGHSLVDLWFTPRLGPLVAAALFFGVLALCWRCRRDDSDSPSFFIAVSLVLAATVVVIPTLAPHAQLLLLPGFLCLYRYRGVLWKSKRWARSPLLAVWLLLAWPWIAVAGLALAAAPMPMRKLLGWWQLPLYASPVLPLAVLVALGWLTQTQPWIADQQNASRSL